MRKMLWMATGATALLIAAACSDTTRPIGSSLRPAGARFTENDPVTGAIFTTDVECIGTDLNIYPTKLDVYIDGGPRHVGSAGLPEGDYYVQVTSPEGTVLGTSVGTGVPKPVHVNDDGNFAKCYQLWAIVASAAPNNPGYDDTPNSGGEYKVWVSQSSDFVNSDTKTDNFKVQISEPPVLLNALLTVSKDVKTTYTRTWKWTIDKTITAGPTPASVQLGQESSIDYKVDLSGDSEASAWQVNGTITIKNDGNAAVKITAVSDVSPVGTAVVGTCTPAVNSTLQPAASMTCPYSTGTSIITAPTYGEVIGVNSAKAEGTYLDTDNETKPVSGTTNAADPSVSVSFPASATTEVGKCVTVNDTYVGLGAPASEQVCATGNTASKSWTYTRKFSTTDAKLCGTKPEIKNTASFTGAGTSYGGQNSVTKTTEVAVVCQNLHVQKFYDANANGKQDAGENLILGWNVAVTGAASGSGSTTFDMNATPLGAYSVTEKPAKGGIWFQTAAFVAGVAYVPLGPTVPVTLAAGDDKTVLFGNVCRVSAGVGHTLGWWANNGNSTVTAADFTGLNGLNLRDGTKDKVSGTLRTFVGTLAQNRTALNTWLLNANSTNAANMLSAQLATTYLSIAHGFTNPSVIVDGTRTIAQELVYATSLLANPIVGGTFNGQNGSNTQAASALRVEQVRVQELLNAINNNSKVFAQPTPDPVLCPIAF